MLHSNPIRVSLLEALRDKQISKSLRREWRDLEVRGRDFGRDITPRNEGETSNYA